MSFFLQHRVNKRLTEFYLNATSKGIDFEIYFDLIVWIDHTIQFPVSSVVMTSSHSLTRPSCSSVHIKGQTCTKPHEAHRVQSMPYVSCYSLSGAYWHNFQINMQLEEMVHAGDPHIFRGLQTNFQYTTLFYSTLHSYIV